jgi:hypothetical protein
MSVYKYIAELNPNQANNLCLQQGLSDASDSDELANNLVAIVAQNGELALKKIMELHPDKDLILEMFQCSSCQSKQQTRPPIMDSMDSEITEVSPLMIRPLQQEFVNASGSTDIAKNTNTIILVSSVLVALAIIASIK